MEQSNQLILKIRPYAQENISKAVMQIINSFVPFMLLWIVSYYFWDHSIIASSMVCMVNAFFLVKIFIIQHDCGHKSYFDHTKHGEWNRLWGWIASVFSTLPFTHWATIHHHHHVHNGKLEVRDIGDINFWTVEEYRTASPLQRFWYRFFRSPVMLFLIVPIFYFVFANRNPFSYSFSEMTKKVRMSQVTNNFVILIVYLQGFLVLGWSFVCIQGLTIFFFSIIAFWFFYVQHSHEGYQRWYTKREWAFEEAALQGSSRYDLHPVFHWLTGYIGIHHIHHLNPAIPSYNLEEVDEVTYAELKDKIKNLSFRESLACIHNKLWDENKKKYITFREFYAR